jgi:catechol 2,3-dioxygenase-like lactoylglutathione lyase family enzyme
MLAPGAPIPVRRVEDRRRGRKIVKVEQIHHVAYRCRNAKETVEFYQKVLGMDFLMAMAEDKAPSTKSPDPYMHVFMDAGNGNIVAFFELPNSPPMGRDPNTPEWVQHIAFRVKDLAALDEAKARAEAAGLDVVGPTDHGVFKSIYFFDPSGNRLELAAVTATPEQMRRLKEIAPAMLDEWDGTKKPPRQAAWVHQKEFA